MKHEDLIKNLENLETPEIELPGHRQALRAALLNSGRFREKTIMDWARILAPITAAVLLIAVVGFFNVIQPQLQMAQAKTIARNDLHVQALMEEYRLDIAEVKLQDGEAIVLLAPESVSAVVVDRTSAAPSIFRWALTFFLKPLAPADEGELAAPSSVLPAGYILKVDFRESKVSELAEIDEVAALGEINLEDIDFVKLKPAEAEASEEADLE